MKKILLTVLIISGLFLFSIKVYAYNRVIVPMSPEIAYNNQYQYFYNYNAPSKSSKYFIEIFPDGSRSPVMFIPYGKVNYYIKSGYDVYPYYERPAYYIPVGPPPYYIPAGSPVMIKYKNN
ncbi:MAG: hypothetical protein M1576_01020 [Deltaproteobacteria bacterium]|nr:hypothetical protein [Deltaproteobacteria bacterium]